MRYLLDFYECDFRPRRHHGKSSHTARLYRLSIKSFGITLATRPTVEDLTDDNVRRHMMRLVDDGRSPATANKDRAHLLALWRFANRSGLIPTWPTVQEYHEPERVPIAWLPGELESLYKAIERQRGEFCGVPRRLWWRCIVDICLDTGERIGAIRMSGRSCVRGDWLLVDASKRKGRTRDKMSQLRSETVQRIASVWQLHRCNHSQCVDSILPWPYSRNYIYPLFGALLKDAGLPDSRRDKFHKLRRTTGSVIWAMGGNPQQVLDHSDSRTTRGYLDPRFDPNKQASQLLSEYLADPSKRSRRIDDRQDGLGATA